MTVTLILQNRIDFCGIIIAERCNPNGDPINANSPRQDWSGHGIISDVCLKRKIRNWLHGTGHEIFVVLQQDLKDGESSLKDRAESMPEMKKPKKDRNEAKFLEEVCEKWIDVRALGQVFAFKGDSFVTTQVRGPVSITDARTLDYIDVYHDAITKCVNLDDPPKGTDYSSDRMGFKHTIDHGAYVFTGSMFPQLAKKTGFSEGDAGLMIDAIQHMFQNDASVRRPSGRIGLHRLYVWRHNCPNGQYSPVKVFRSLQLTPENEYPYYSANLETLPGLAHEIIEGW